MVNTFLPFSDFKKTARCLDNKRLMKQRVEAYQIINIIVHIRSGKRKRVGFQNHPAVQQWKHNLSALKLYFNTMITEVEHRGFKNSLKRYRVSSHPSMPWWMGYKLLHATHKASLFRKDRAHYIKYFSVNPTYLCYSYVWPSKLTPDQKKGIKNGKKYRISTLAEYIC